MTSTLLATPPAFNLLDTTPAIRIRRAFDIRRVLNSETELRLSFDVPTGASAQHLKVQVQKETLSIHCGNGIITLPFRGVDVCNVQASLSSSNHILEIIAPKIPSGEASHCDHIHNVVLGQC